jgi:hypothetical protein
LRGLLLIGQRVGDAPNVERICQAREVFGVALAALLEADGRLNCGRHSEVIRSVFAARGLYPETAPGPIRELAQ